MLQVHPSARVASASIKLEMLLFEFFSPEERRCSSPTRPETMHGLTKGRSVRPAVRPGEGNSPTIKPYREYVPFISFQKSNFVLLLLRGTRFLILNDDS